MKTITTKNLKLLLFLTLISGAFFTSCKKTDVVPAPTVEIHEIGNEQKEAYAASDLHVDVDIVALGVIENIKVQITPAGTGTGWTYTNTYTGDYTGKKNAEFHEHIDIPADAKIGDYKFVIVVTDKNGKSTTKSDNFKILEADPSLPSFSGLSVVLSANKNDLIVSGTITAPNKISKTEITVTSSAWSKTYLINDATMVGQTSFVLNKSLDISAAPAGHYHAIVKVTDQSGKSVDQELHFDK